MVIFFFSSRMGIEEKKEKIAEEEMFIASTFYTSVCARMHARLRLTTVLSKGRVRAKKRQRARREEKKKKEKTSSIIANERMPNHLH